MKKLIPLMIGLGLVLGTTTFAFGQETKTEKKTKKKKKSETTKKDGGAHIY